jgi:alpha-tubulin suppressor-like RCC1 family protein
MDLSRSRWTSGAQRRVAAALIAALVAALTLVIAATAQAHEPYLGKAWGLNHNGQLGDGTTTGPEECGPEKAACSTTPVEVSKLSGVTAIAGGPAALNHFSVALLENGSVMAWGAGFQGQLGDGKTTASDVPVAVSGLSSATAIAAGEEHGLALLSDGTVMAWGYNGNGELGDGTFETRDLPVPVCAPRIGAPKEPPQAEPCPSGPYLSGVVAIAAGGEHSLAVLSDGTVVAWGKGNEGQLGNGTTTGSDLPVKVSGLTEATAVAAGNNHSLALLKAGTVKAWGKGTEGQLGNGTATSSDVPVAVSGLKAGEVTAIAGGQTHSLALLSNGTVKAWGSNAKGQLGDGMSTGPETCGVETCSKTPVEVTFQGGTVVSAVSAGAQHSLALLSNGTVEAWGANGSGQLGVGTSLGPEPCGPGVCSTKPVLVSNLVGAKGIGAGGEHSLAFGPPPPIVTAISPNEARKKGSTTVTIIGAELEEATAVKFGPNNATHVTVSENGTKITAVAPPGKGTVDVTVTTPAGTSATSPADKFFYSRPTVKTLSPRKGPELGGTSVTITGTNFAGASAVKFGSTEATSFKVNSETSITAVSPPHTGGKVDVTVATPNGTTAISSKDRFRYT